jgi:hypothetical protein
MATSATPERSNDEIPLLDVHNATIYRGDTRVF